MTQIGHFLCLLLGCLIGHLIVYIARGIWNFLTEKRVEIPEIKYDVADNPILSLKNRLGQAYVASHDQTVKKLLHRLLEYVEVIEEWHKAKIHLAETECATYKTRAARLNVELEIERSKNAELEKQLKEEREKNKIPIFSDQTEVPAYLINENTFGGQTNSFAKIILNTKPGEPLTATEATELAERLMNMTSKPIVMDSETLNETQTKNEEFIKQLRDWWGLEAQKAVELPNTDQKKQDDSWVDAIEAARDPNKWPEYMEKVEGIPKNFNKYKVTLYDNKENETIETELWGANIYDALKSVDAERYSAVGYRCVMRNKGWC